MINVDRGRLQLVDPEARPDLGHHLRIELELLLAQLVVAHLVALKPAVKLFWVKDAHASFAGDVLAGHCR